MQVGRQNCVRDQHRLIWGGANLRPSIFVPWFSTGWSQNASTILVWISTDEWSQSASKPNLPWTGWSASNNFVPWTFNRVGAKIASNRIFTMNVTGVEPQRVRPKFHRAIFAGLSHLYRGTMPMRIARSWHYWPTFHRGLQPMRIAWPFGPYTFTKAWCPCAEHRPHWPCLYQNRGRKARRRSCRWRRSWMKRPEMRSRMGGGRIREAPCGLTFFRTSDKAATARCLLLWSRSRCMCMYMEEQRNLLLWWRSRCMCGREHVIVWCLLLWSRTGMYVCMCGEQPGGTVTQGTRRICAGGDLERLH